MGQSRVGHHIVHQTAGLKAARLAQGAMVIELVAMVAEGIERTIQVGRRHPEPIERERIGFVEDRRAMAAGEPLLRTFDRLKFAAFDVHLDERRRSPSRDREQLRQGVHPHATGRRIVRARGGHVPPWPVAHKRHGVAGLRANSTFDQAHWMREVVGSDALANTRSVLRIGLDDDDLISRRGRSDPETADIAAEVQHLRADGRGCLERLHQRRHLGRQLAVPIDGQLRIVALRHRQGKDTDRGGDCFRSRHAYESN